jgi:hypothetical protein
MTFDEVLHVEGYSWPGGERGEWGGGGSVQVWCEDDIRIETEVVLLEVHALGLSHLLDVSDSRLPISSGVRARQGAKNGLPVDRHEAVAPMR